MKFTFFFTIDLAFCKKKRKRKLNFVLAFILLTSCLINESFTVNALLVKGVYYRMKRRCNGDNIPN